MVMINNVLSHKYAHILSVTYYTLSIPHQYPRILYFGILHNAQFLHTNWITYSWRNKNISTFIFLYHLRKNMYSKLNFKRKTAENTPSLYVRLADTWVLVQKSVNFDCSQCPSEVAVLALLLNQFQVPLPELLLVGSRMAIYISISLYTLNINNSIILFKKIYYSRHSNLI